MTAIAQEDAVGHADEAVAVAAVDQAEPAAAHEVEVGEVERDEQAHGKLAEQAEPQATVRQVD